MNRVRENVRRAMQTLRRRIGPQEEGSATVEFAIALPAIIAALVFSLTLMNATMARVQAQEIARQGARLAIVGASVQDLADEKRAQGFTLITTVNEPWVSVTVRKKISILGIRAVKVQISEEASGYLESHITGELP